MKIPKTRTILLETDVIESETLDRNVTVDFYLPTGVAHPAKMSLLLINDGQDLERMNLISILDDLYDQDRIDPVLSVGIYAGPDRKLEYGTAGELDYKGRGSKAGDYTLFIFDTLLPYIRKKFNVPEFKEKAFAGFSLGALSALDIVWSQPSEFTKAGIFSGALWWRNKDKFDPTYSDANSRIMHQRIRKGRYHDWLKFFFECGGADEGEDRNKNGVIDSIDDTLDLIAELKAMGYPDKQIHYWLIEEGKHDVATWALAMPEFLLWGWKRPS
ncbi:MAG: alpha/beta hydrolase [Chitinophagales bacterium]